jgi:hypothetical protein
MIHPQLGKRRGVRGVLSFAYAPLFAFLVGGPMGLARAGEFDRSTLPAAVAHPARCDGRNEGLGVLKDFGDCKRISGYIAAGARFGADEQIGGAPSPFGKLDAPEFVGAVRAAGAALIAVPAGLDRIFLPPSAADEAR